jgi:hypothetical protein
VCAVHTVLAWISCIDSADQLTPVPQQHLLVLLQALTQPADPTAALINSDITALSCNCKLLTDAAVQLCSAAPACACAHAELHTSAQAPAQPGAIIADTNTVHLQQHDQQPPSQVQQQQYSPQEAAAAASAATNHSMDLLFWSCHLTTALHQVCVGVSSQQHRFSDWCRSHHVAPPLHVNWHLLLLRCPEAA